MKKRMFAMVFAVILCVSLMPAAAMAGGAWYEDGIRFCQENELLQDAPDNSFDPDGPLSRAVAVSMLYRFEGGGAFMNDNIFSDVPYGCWYEKAVVWANGKDIVRGCGGELFGPEDPLTREQWAAMLYRYTKYEEIYKAAEPQTVPEEDLTAAFADAGSVSAYAKEAVNWAIQKGLMKGGSGLLLPADNVTGAQAAVMLQRFAESKTAAE